MSHFSRVDYNERKVQEKRRQTEGLLVVIKVENFKLKSSYIRKVFTAEAANDPLRYIFEVSNTLLTCSKSLAAIAIAIETPVTAKMKIMSNKRNLNKKYLSKIKG